MKKFLLMLFVLLASFTTQAQTITQQDWTIENQGQWGSFYWKVDRTTNADVNGVYYYYVHFYSNSLFNSDVNNDGNLDKAVTYIKQPTVYMYEYSNGNHYNTVNVPLNFILCDYIYTPTGYMVYFSSYSAYNNFGLTFTSASPYHYSNY